MATTIKIKEETKRVLSALKGDKDWDSFLRELAENVIAMKREKLRAKLRELLVENYEEVKVKGWTREF